MNLSLYTMTDNQTLPLTTKTPKCTQYTTGCIMDRLGLIGQSLQEEEIV